MKKSLLFHCLFLYTRLIWEVIIYYSYEREERKWKKVKINRPHTYRFYFIPTDLNFITPKKNYIRHFLLILKLSLLFVFVRILTRRVRTKVCCAEWNSLLSHQVWTIHLINHKMNYRKVLKVNDRRKFTQLII